MSDTANIAKINVGGLEYNIKDLLAYDHINKYDNPHEVNKEQVGLGNVENLTPEQLLKEYLKADIINAALGYTPGDSENVDNKIDKTIDSEVTAIVNFINGIKLNGAYVKYDVTTNTVTFS